MTILIYTLIYAAIAVMAYNIVRYLGFMRRICSIGDTDLPCCVIAAPGVLLAAFFVGYLAVALFGEPDIIIAGILFGGSLFVLIMLGVIYRIVDRLREGSERASVLYEQARSNYDGITKDYLAVYRINLTRDTVEDRSGPYVVSEDECPDSYTELLATMRRNLAGQSAMGLGQGDFSRDKLLACFKEGHTSRHEAFLCLLESGELGYVKMSAILAAEPMTGDILAFITLARCNDEVVTETLLDKALIEQYDMITSLVGGTYRVLIGKDDGTPGNIFPREKDGDYMQYLADQVAPVVLGTPEEKIATMSSLGINRIESELSRHEPYAVDIACQLDGQTYYKRFVFYVVDARARFYLLLKSDTTDVRREELARNRMLEDALVQAQNASKSKTIFLSNMSHDIRTPMNAIVAYTDFALQSDDVERMHGYLEKIDASSKHLLALINDVLEMSRIESGKIELELGPVNLAAAIQGVHDIFSAQVTERNIEFNVDSSRICNANVLCDKNRLNRVVLNLLSNAFKFTPDGGTVTLVFRQVSPAAEGFAGYELSVKDTGIGMSPEFAARVFDAFERERTSTVSGVQGTGLGMAITKRIVDMMGGTITVKTAPGAGTEFIVHLQLQLQDPMAVECSAAKAPETRIEDVDFAGMHALLAEDNEINREIAVIILEELGFTLDVAANGREAVDMLADAGPGRYNVVITDIQMPVMDGYEMARAIRALPDGQLARIPIIAISANAFQEDVRAACDAGIDGYVAKPIDVAQLTQTLAEALG